MTSNPQAKQMGDESMARNLAHQAQAIWPQERELFRRYQLSGSLSILDLGAGTGEISMRLADLYPEARVQGIDILASNLELARAATARQPSYAGRVEFAEGDAFELSTEDACFDLVVCRHLSQAVPEFPRVLSEITRVLRPGGWLHCLSEDYGMLHMPRGSGPNLDEFWALVVLPYLEQLGCDGRIGRHTLPLVQALGYAACRVDYLVIDTERVNRSTLAAIFSAWQAGYVEPLSEASGRPASEIAACFQAMIAAVEDPAAYTVWHVPIISAQKMV